MDDSVQPPNPKRIKLEEDPSEGERLLSQRRHSKGGRRPKFTTEERALILLNDDRISAVEPQQVLCRMCGQWVKLFKHTAFSSANWRTHAEKCEPRSGWKERIQADPGAALTLTIAPLSPGHSDMVTEQALVPSGPIASPSTTSMPQVQSSVRDNVVSDGDSNEPLEVDAMLVPPRRITKTTADRRREVENDTRCEKPGPHQVLCKMCGQWVRLHNTREYDLWNWLRHAEKCEIKNGWVIPDSGDQIPNGVFAGPGEGTVSTNTFPDGGSTYPENMMDAPRTQTATDSSRTVTRALRRRLSAPQSSKSETRHRPEKAAPASAEGDTSAESRSFRWKRPTYTQSEQGDIFIHESVVSPGAPGEAASSNDLRRESTNGQAIPTVKAEPNADEWPTHARGPSFEDESISTTLFVGMKRRKGRTVEERKQALLSDTRIGQVLPNEVFCNMCQKWIKLYKEVDYVESNWTRHAERCSLRVAAKQQPVGVRGFISVPASSTSLSVPTSPPKRSPVKSNEERRHDLESDPYIGAVEPHQVLCLICKQWVKLQSYREYDIWNWRKHLSLCEQRHSDVAEGSSQTSPRRRQQATLPSEPKRSSRLIKAEETDGGPPAAPIVAGHLTAPPKIPSAAQAKDETSAEDRRAILVRDGRCENIEPQRVTCRLCRRVVGLHVKKDYSLSNWYKHIASCDKTSEKVAKIPLRTPLTAIGVSRPSIAAGPSTTSTDTGLEESVKALVNDTPPEQDTEVQVVTPAPPQTSKATKSTPAERRRRLLADTRVETVEPNRIKCRLCQHWLKLNEFMDYAPYNWYKHIERCEARSSTQGKGTSVEPIVIKEENVENAAVAPDLRIPEEPSISLDGGLRKRTTPAERLARMQTDPRIKTIEKHRARCGICDKWVKLQNKTEYDPHNWFAHVKKCAGKTNVPKGESSSVQEPVELRETKEPSPTIIADSDSGKISNPTILGRRSLLLNDIRSAAVEPHRVLCGICNQWIKLRDGKLYVPYNWLKHKRKCEKRNGLPQTSVIPNEDVIVAPRVAKKESVAADIGLRHNDARKITEEEREARLRADPRLGDVEPGRVFCKMCDSWIRLNMATGFLPGNWDRHAQRCKGRTGYVVNLSHSDVGSSNGSRPISWQGATPEFIQERPELSTVEVIDLETDNAEGHFGFIELARLIGKFEPTVSSTDYGNLTGSKPSTPAPTKQLSSTWSMPTLRARPSVSRLNSPSPLSHTNSEPKVQDQGKRMHRSEEARKLELESDPRTKIVNPEKILCGMCDRWIQMRRDVAYSPQNWLKHAGICEQRSGWVKKHKVEGGTDAKPAVEPVIRNTSEELVPYNARKLLEEDKNDFDAPPLKPVDWGQVFSSDDDDDDDGEVTLINDASIPMSKVAISLEPNQAHVVPVHHQDALSMNNISNVHSAPKMSVPTPLAAMRANKADLKAHPTTVPSSVEMKSASASSPIIAPFTTVPLPFYRAPYPPHFIRPGYHTMNKDNAPPKPASPQHNNAHQRSLPFVVPAPSMLPHLLPRPVLIPISHTSRQASRTISPYPISVTPPVPPTVPPMGMLSPGTVPHSHSLGTPQVSAASSITSNAHKGDPANSISLLNTTTSIHEHSTLMAEPDTGKAIFPPCGAEDTIQKSGTVPIGHDVPSIALNTEVSMGLQQREGGMTENMEVLQLRPRVDLPLEKDKANSTKLSSQGDKRGPVFKDSAPMKAMPDVLQLGPRVDMPMETPRRERLLSISTTAENESRPERTLPPTKPGPGVLQLAPGLGMLREKEMDKLEREGSVAACAEY